MKIQLTSFENSSILRKFTILYIVMSIIPMIVVYVMYLQVKGYTEMMITQDNILLVLLFVILGVTVGYFAMRSWINGIIDITTANRSTLEDILGPEKIRSLSSGSSNEISILAKSFNEITSRLEENVRNLQLAQKTLHSVLSRVGDGISSMENIDNFLNLIVETVTEGLQGRTGTLMLFDERTHELRVQAVYGVPGDNRKAFKINEQHDIFRDVLAAKKVLTFDRVAKDGLPAFVEAPVLCAPLILHDKVLGFITVSGRRSEQVFTEEERNLLHSLALQTAVAIENSRLNEDAEKTYFETISALALAVEAKDTYSRGHLDRVAKYVVQIGKELGLPEEEIKLLRDGARLHDLGKIGVTDKVLTKNGPLTAQEMEMMKKHCEIGEGIIKPIRSLRNLCDMVRHHHEKLDGSGYPDGLKGDQIQQDVRILTVADIFDALTSNRSYRSPFTFEKACEQLRGMKDQLDQRIVEALIRSLPPANS